MDTLETSVVYVSPPKALSNDIHLNLRAPLAGIIEQLAALGLPEVGIRTAVRTGDTPQRERALLRRKPPHVLVTTPESLYVPLGSDTGRATLATEPRRRRGRRAAPRNVACCTLPFPGPARKTAMKPFASSLAVAALAGATAGLLSALAPSAVAQTKSDAEIRQQYLADRAACLSGRTGEDQQTCLREAGAAAQAARQGKLLEGERENYRSNALARCAPLPPEQREACRMRIEGAGTVTGSVEEGGLFRELRIEVPASSTMTTPAPAPATTVVPASPAAAPVVVPGTASTAPAASTPSATGSSGVSGGPTFTPVQPAIPGRSVPSAPRSSAPPAASTAEAASPGSLQITPPTNPVMQVPAPPPTYSPQPALAAPVPAAPEPALVTPGSVPPGGAL